MIMYNVRWPGYLVDQLLSGQPRYFKRPTYFLSLIYISITYGSFCHIQGHVPTCWYSWTRGFCGQHWYVMADMF